MAYSSIIKPTDYFNTKLYTGTGSAQSITGVGFQPDFVWIKNRSATFNHQINDAVRGVNKQIAPNNTNAQETNTGELTAFGSDGFTVGSGGTLNGNGNNIVSWNWKAGTTSGITTNGATVTTPSSYSFNQTAGLSILQYTGTGVTNNKLAHGLGVKPDFIIFKKTSGDINWGIYHQSLTADYRLLFNTAAQSDDDSFMQDSEPDSVNINLGYGGLNNASGATYIAYCFAEKTGFSKFGSYIGNGSTNGTFTYTGFKPAFVMVKYASPGGGVGNWGIFDSVRNPANVVDKGLLANTNAAEDTSDFIDILSNGFKQRSSSSNRNENGSTYVYMAFAEHPFTANVDGGLPTTAR